MKINFFHKSKNNEELAIARFVLKQFSYRPKQIKYFIKALTHKSAAADKTQNQTNERLEFLGDAVLDTVVAAYLFNKYPELDEGQLTKIKSKIVNRKSLSLIGERMGIRNHLLYSQGRSINLVGLEGNAFEALIGAIYLDAGYEITSKVLINTVLRKHLNLKSILEEELDFKSTLFIWCQRKKLNLAFELIKEEIIDGKTSYEMVVCINKIKYGKGTGGSKKEAEQTASKETLILMGEI